MWTSDHGQSALLFYLNEFTRLQYCIGTYIHGHVMSTICVSGSFLSSLLFKLKNAPGDAVSESVNGCSQFVNEISCI